MRKNYFASILLSALICAPVCAENAVFSNSDTENFSLQPLNYSTKEVTKAKDTNTVQAQTSNSSSTSNLTNKNYQSAINNLDSAEVQLREQIANYSTLMAQAKTAYETKKDEYNAYKREYNELKKKLNNIEKSKKLIQGNYAVNNTTH